MTRYVYMCVCEINKTLYKKINNITYIRGAFNRFPDIFVQYVIAIHLMR